MRVILKRKDRPDKWFDWEPDPDPKKGKKSIMGPEATSIVLAADDLIEERGIVKSDESGRTFKFKDSPYTNKYDMAIVLMDLGYEIPDGWPVPRPEPFSGKEVEEEDRIRSEDEP